MLKSTKTQNENLKMWQESKTKNVIQVALRLILRNFFVFPSLYFLLNVVLYFVTLSFFILFRQIFYILQTLAM